MYRHLMSWKGLVAPTMDDKTGSQRYLLESICNVDAVLHMSLVFDNGGGGVWKERCSVGIDLPFLTV